MSGVTAARRPGLRMREPASRRPHLASRRPHLAARPSWLVQCLGGLWLACLVLLTADVADAKPGIVAMDFEGPRAREVRGWAVRILDKSPTYDVKSRKLVAAANTKLDGSSEQNVALARELELSAILLGVVSQKGARWTLNLTVVNGADGKELTTLDFAGTFPVGLKKTLAKELLKRVEEPLSKANPPGAAEEAAAVVTPAPQPKKKPKPEQKAKPKKEKPKAPKKAANTDHEEDAERPTALEATLLVAGSSREFSYTDDIFGAVRPYSLGAAPAVELDLELYPGALFTDGVAAHLGLVASYEKAFALSSEAPDGDTLDTSSSELLAGLRIRLPLGDHELGLTGKYGIHAFEVEDGDRQLVPGVEYRFLRAGLDGRLRFGSVLLGVAVGYRLVQSAGEIEKAGWFPNTSAAGIDARLLGGFELTPGFDVLLGADLRRYGFSFDPEPGDTLVAGGATDQYLRAWVGAGYRL